MVQSLPSAVDVALTESESKRVFPKLFGPTWTYWLLMGTQGMQAVTTMLFDRRESLRPSEAAEYGADHAAAITFGTFEALIACACALSLIVIHRLERRLRHRARVTFTASHIVVSENEVSPARSIPLSSVDSLDIVAGVVIVRTWRVFRRPLVLIPLRTMPDGGRELRAYLAYRARAQWPTA